MLVTGQNKSKISTYKTFTELWYKVYFIKQVQETPLWAHIEVIVKETTPLGQFVLYYLNIL